MAVDQVLGVVTLLEKDLAVFTDPNPGRNPAWRRKDTRHNRLLCCGLKNIRLCSRMQPAMRLVFGCVNRVRELGNGFISPGELLCRLTSY